MVYLILPVYNRIEQTKKFINDLLGQIYQDFHLVLVDDGSTDGSAEMIKERLSAKSTILKGTGNWWWGGSLHQGYLFLSDKIVEAGDYVLIMNNDTSFEADFIQKGIDRIKSDEKLLLTANAYSLETHALIDSGVTIDWNEFEFKPSVNAEEINCLSTRGLILHLSAFKQIGGFYPRLLPHYLSDYEYTHRAFRKGFKLITDSTFRLLVDESSTGVEVVGESGVVKFRDLFSKRYKSNPFYRINFIVLSNDNVPKNARFVIRELYTMYRSLLGIAVRKIRNKKDD
jgi:GT2 family glycosyltransferase